MIYGSVCSGIEAATVAWHPLGWRAAWYSEIEKFPNRVLAHHYPETPNLGDMTKIHELEAFRERPIELLVGGTPCQSFSVAGLRKGLADPRGNLALVFLGLVDQARPRWVVWENVPGVLSSKGGWDFGAFLGGLAELGYGFAYRVLDAQHFGVPQRRRRVFVVGHLGDWRCAAAVLFERQSLSGNPAPSRKARKDIADGVEFGPSGGGLTDISPTLDARAQDGPRRNQLAPAVFTNIGNAKYAEGFGTLRAEGADCGGESENLVVGTLQNSGRAAGSATQQDAESGLLVTHTLKAQYDASEDGTGRGTPLVPISIHPRAIGRDEGGPAGKDWRDDGQAFTLDTGGGGAVLPINTQIATRHEALGEGTGLGIGKDGDPAFTLQSAHSHGVMAQMQVRRLTPRECERLQGFPDDYTLVPRAADGPRYKALGNSMAVPVMHWIGKRIEIVNSFLKQ